MKLPCTICKETPSETVTCKTCLTCWCVSVTTLLQALATWECPRCKSDDDARSILDNGQQIHRFIKPIVRNTDNNGRCYYRTSASSRNIAGRRRGPEEASLDGRKGSKKRGVTMPSSSRMPPQDSDDDSPSDAWPRA